MAKGNDKRFNKKSRTQNVKTVVVADKNVVGTIGGEANGSENNDRVNEYGTEGNSNALVIKAKNVVVTKEPEKKRKLSRKRRKHLEKLLDQKDKKTKRGELLERLGKLQVPAAELEQYKSIAHLGTNHTHKSLAKLPDKNFAAKINTVKGGNKKGKKVKKDEIIEKSEESEEVSTDESEDEEMPTEEQNNEPKTEKNRKRTN